MVLGTAEELYNQLIAPIEGKMIRTVARIVRHPEEAADTFQNVLARIWKNLPRIHRHPNPHAYILRACVTASIDTLRKTSRQRQHEQPFNEGHTVETSSVSGSSKTDGVSKEAILRAIGSLPRCQSEAILLREIQGMSFEEVAGALECKEVTVRSHVSKGKARLRQILTDFVNI